jgi:hypothetical protein
MAKQKILPLIQAVTTREALCAEFLGQHGLKAAKVDLNPFLLNSLSVNEIQFISISPKYAPL